MATEYEGNAGGWGALKSSMKFLQREGFAKGAKTLFKMNQPKGFDCPGCAWPDPKKTSAIAEYCENGVKALNYETTKKRATKALFMEKTVSEMSTWDDFTLEDTGRLTEPFSYNQKTDKYEAISWDEAFTMMAEEFKALENPNDAIFYTSGRTSNEAAFLYQLFGRMLGTNNVPDCSNMCHESSGVAMSETVGIGKGTVSLEDFEEADAIYVFGQNPGTNHPRMLSELQEASKRGARIVSFNPLKEAGLLADQAIIVNAVSGVTGAGRKASVNTHFCEVSLAPYGLFNHRHTPEIEQHLGHPVLFTPHLGNFPRGILETIYVQLKPGVTAEQVNAAYQVLANEPLIRLLGNKIPSIKGVAKQPFVDIAWQQKGEQLIVMSAIDNLLKGAAGQALQCINLAMGEPHHTGLVGAL